MSDVRIAVIVSPVSPAVETLRALLADRIARDYGASVLALFGQPLPLQKCWRYDTVRTITWLLVAGVDQNLFEMRPSMFRSQLCDLPGVALIGQRITPGFYRQGGNFLRWRIQNPYARPVRKLEHAITIIQNAEEGPERPRPPRKIWPKGHPNHVPCLKPGTVHFDEVANQEAEA